MARNRALHVWTCTVTYFDIISVDNSAKGRTFWEMFFYQGQEFSGNVGIYIRKERAVANPKGSVLRDVQIKSRKGLD